MKKILFCSFTLFSIMTATAENESSSPNLLLKDFETPFATVPFEEITPADMVEAILEGIKIHDLEIEKIVSNPEPATFENTIAALDRSGEILNRSVLILSNLEHAMGDTILMNTYAKVMPAISEHSTNILLNEPLWNRIKVVNQTIDQRSDLTPEQKRLTKETYRNFAESGANLTGEDRKKFKEINSKLSELSLLYGQNVANEMKNPDRRLWVKEEDTKGLPQAIKDAARAEAKSVLESEGKADDENLYLFTMFMPSYSPFLKYAENRDLREKLFRLYNSRNNGGDYDNIRVLKNIANLRLELAQLMGKQNFAEYNLQGTMAATPANVYNLLNQLNDSYSAPMKEELKEIEEFARLSEGNDFTLQPWDYSFWSNKLKNEKYSFNEEDMKPYFELENTIQGVLGLAQKLYGYSFKENKDLQKYHPDVKVYEVYENDGSLLGILYADFYYREGKSPGAWMTEFRTETKNDDGVRNLPLISIVTNFSKPIGNEPVLLTPYEVETFLHEFGHALHGLSSQATYPSLSGTNVYHDFVELFSQFNENYLTEKEYLDGFAKHYKTGEKMPQELIERFVESNRFGAAYACMRQLGFGFLDMAYHTIQEPLAEDCDISVFENNSQDKVRIFDVIEGALISPSFGHIFSGGYAAGYYGYKWAEVLEADAFEAFKENGIFDPETAKRFKKMLQSGGTVDPMELYIEFRGQAPDVKSLLKRDGIIK